MTDILNPAQLDTMFDAVDNAEAAREERAWTAAGIYDVPDTAEDRAQAEADRADREKDRADGAEAHARALLAEIVWRQAAEQGYDPDLMPADRLESIVDCLWDDLEGGTRAGDLTANPHVIAWGEGR